MPIIQPIPGPININIAPGTIGVDFDYAVYAKEQWDHANWTLIPHLIPISAIETDINGSSQADFVYDFGRVKQLPIGAFRAYESIIFSNTAVGIRPLRDLFVAIKVMPKDLTDTYCIWSGFLPSEQIELRGNVTTSLTGTPTANYPLQTGQQVFRAYGFQYLLERRSPRGAVVWGGVDVGGVTPTRTPQVAPPFNSRGQSGRHILGNRSLERISQSVLGTTKSVSYGFGDDAQRWSVLQVIEYLLYWSNDLSARRPLIFLDGTADPTDATLTQGSNTFDPLLYLLNNSMDFELSQEDFNVLSSLRRLIDPRRGFGGVLRWSELDAQNLPAGDSDILLSLFSFADRDITIGGITHPGNARVFEEDIDTSNNLAIRAVNVEVDSSNVYDEVVIQGEPMVVCFSGVVGQPTAAFAPFKPAWSSADELSYKASIDAGRANDLFQKIYTTFKLCSSLGTDGFDWKRWDGESLLPTFDNNAMIQADSGPGGYLNFGKGLLRELPLAHPFDVAAEIKDSGYVRSFAVFEQLNSSGGGTGKWELADKPSFPGQGNVLAVFDISARVTPDDRELQISVQFPYNHATAKNHFTLLPSDPPVFAQPRFDWEKMILTVAVKSDTRPAVVLRPTLPYNAPNMRRLVIDVDGCETWWVAPGTIWGLTATGALRPYPQSGLVRDDTQRLRDIAVMATRMYGQPHISVKITRHGIYDIYAVGSMLKAKTKSTLVHLQRDPNDTSDTREILSIITARTWDFRKKEMSVVTGPINYGDVE